MMYHKNLVVGYILSLVVLCACGTCSAGVDGNFSPTATTIPVADITVCAEDCDFTSLKAALEAVSTTAGLVISLEDAVHTEAGIAVNKNVTIQGKGQFETIIQAAESVDAAIERIFLIPAGNQVAIRHLTMRHGNPQGDVRSGGAIRNEGDLTLENVNIHENQASAGGGILNDGTLYIVNSSIHDNIAKGGGDYFTECKTGGAIKIMSGPVTIENSSIYANSAKGKGGGIHVACLGELYLTNSTISGNYSYADGGGIFINGMAVIINSTIVENKAINGGGISAEGSGEKDAVRGQLSFKNSIIANNYTRLEEYGTEDCLMGRNTEIALNENNWVSDGSCDAEFSGELFLELLSDNGGFTLTHLLAQGSPAADLLPKDDCVVLFDQRGVSRVAPCDLGAVEIN